MKNKIGISTMLAVMMGLGAVPKLPTPKKRKKLHLGLPRNMRPHQSAREKMRRVRQGKAGTRYVHGAQYSGQEHKIMRLQLGPNAEWRSKWPSDFGEGEKEWKREKRFREEYLGQFF